MNKMMANVSIAAGVALALCKKEEGSMSAVNIIDKHSTPLDTYSYDIIDNKILRIIRRRVGMLVRLDSSWIRNPQFKTPQEAYDAGMALGDFKYVPNLNNFRNF